MTIENPIVTGGAAVALMWAVREFLAFILKMRKQDQEQFYRPEEEWKKYIMGKFESLGEKLSSVSTAQENIKGQVSRLEFEVLKLIKGGK